MTTPDQRKQLNAVVESILERREPTRFGESWEMAAETLGRLPVRGFYVSADQGYANVAIMADGLLVDVEGDDEGDDGRGSVSVRRLGAVTGVDLFGGPVEGIPESEEAQLVLMVYVEGGETVDLHWVAYTDEERGRLLQFGGAVIDAITGDSG